MVFAARVPWIRLSPTQHSRELSSVRDEQPIGRSHYDGLNFSFRERMLPSASK